MSSRQTLPPSIDEIAALADAAVLRLPPEFRRWLDGVIFRVDDFPDEETLQDMGFDSPFDLLGLYRGIAIGQKSSTHSGALPDMIHLYRRPILDYWAETGESLEDIVVHVLVHEVGHHFGLSDADMARIEAAAG